MPCESRSFIACVCVHSRLRLQGYLNFVASHQRDVSDTATDGSLHRYPTIMYRPKVWCGANTALHNGSSARPVDSSSMRLDGHSCFVMCISEPKKFPSVATGLIHSFIHSLLVFSVFFSVFRSLVVDHGAVSIAQS